MNLPDLETRKCMVFVAHPGHELRIHRFLEIARPVVHVITDGSGSKGSTRLASTRSLVLATRARPGDIFGRYSDRDIYALLLAHDFQPFIALAGELAASMEREGTDLIAGDMVEGYNSIHDVCRLLIGAAVSLAQKKSGRTVANYDFPLVGMPDRMAGQTPGEILIQLDPAALERKLQAARNYPELAQEVEHALKEAGTAPFAREVLRPVESAEGYSRQEQDAPYYETYGRKQVEAGLYRDVIGHAEHIAPLAAALNAHCHAA